MDSLADKIIANNDKNEKKAKDLAATYTFFNYDLPEKDEFGMPTANSIEYVIARIIYIDYNISGKDRLHLREDGRIWEGDHWLSENDRNLYKITQWAFKPFTSDQKHRIWVRLRECLPSLSYEKMVVKDNLVWDMKNNELYFSDEEPLTIN